MQNINLIPNFVLRTPLLSWSVVDIFLKIEDPIQQEEYLRKIFAEPIIKEALFVASKDLHQGLDQWLRQEIDHEKSDKLKRSLTKYLLRMGTRCTPFGLFAGISIGQWGANGNLIVGDEKEINKYCSLDTEYLFNAKEAILNEFPTLLDHVKFYPNSTLVEAHDRYLFVDYHYKEHIRRFGLSAVTKTEYLDQVLAIAKDGAPFQQLIDSLKRFDVSLEEAYEYLVGLFRNQIIVSELEPMLSNGYYFDQLYSTLTNLTVDKNFNKVIENFKSIKANLNSINEGRNYDTNLYNFIQFNSLKSLSKVQNSFQVDMIKPILSGQLEFSIAVSIQKGIEIVNKLSGSNRDSAINSFKEKFRERYESQEVLLMEVFDVEIGLEYQRNNSMTDYTPLLNNVSFDFSKNSSNRRLTWGQTDSLLLAKVLESKFKDSVSVEILEDDVKNLSSDWSNLPDSFSVIASTHEEEIQGCSNTLIHIIAGVGSSAVNTFSRFTHLNHQFENLADEIIKYEESLHGENILAELIHMPAYTRMGNILQRRISRKYDVTFLASSNKENNNIIELSDLLISLVGNRFVLRSKKHQKQVTIKLSNVHNYSADPHPLYQFLGDLQYQNMRWPIQLNWGPLEDEYVFLPRLTFKNIILSLAKWHFKKKHFISLLKERANKKERRKLINQFAETWKIPKLFAIADSDNLLLINLESEICLDVFFDILSKRSAIKLSEFIKPSLSLVKDSNGNCYANEIIALFTKRDEPSRIKFQTNSSLIAQRQFNIGEQWVYYKIYAGTKGIESLLLKVFRPLIEGLLKNGVIDQWFFIRYSDPDYHLRIRFHLVSVENWQWIVQSIKLHLDEYLKNKTIRKVQLDTYQREIERYGATSISLTESIFFIDSMYTLDVLQSLQRLESSEDLRWLYALRSIDDFLNIFEMSVDDKLKIIKTFDKSASNGINKQNQLSVKYRLMKVKIEEAFDPKPNSLLWQKINIIQESKSKQLMPIAKEINKLKSSGAFEVNFYNYIGSCIHMMVNRLCLARPNDHEMILYSFLFRYYSSLSARYEAKG
jgi:thiopeptide-type bacteriocin biosynthesis protein